MKNNRNLLTVIFLSLSLSGCLSAKEQNYKFDYDSGLFEMDFHDIRADKDSVAKDWASVKEALDKKDDFNPQVIAVKSKNIFQEGGVLSGHAVYQVQCPKCFPSQLDILKMIYDDGRWEENNNEIFLIVPKDTRLTVTNGTLLRTAKSNIAVWPNDTKHFEFTIAEDNSKAVSLLENYLNEHKENKI